MTAYVALLRGVNVGGRTIRMAELGETARALGWSEVRTALASGNLRFESDADAASARAALEAALLDRFAAAIRVHVLTVPALAELVAAYPFPRGRDGWHDYAVVVGDAGVLAALGSWIAEADGSAPERMAVGAGVVYWTVPKGSTLASRFGKRLAARAVAPEVTTRNLNTLERLLA